VGARVIRSLAAAALVSNAGAATAAEPASVPPPVATATQAPAPPLPPPEADEQSPRPYLLRPRARQPIRNVDVGPDVGIAFRPADGDSVSYGAAFSYGLHARVEVLRWLGVRALVLRSNHSVEVPRGGLGLADTEIDHPDIELNLLGIRVEPTWVLDPRLRLWAGLGAGWAFMETEAPTTSGALELQSAGRDGVIVEFSGALGATLDVIPDWLTASIALSAGTVTGQTGDIFRSMQGFDQNGRMLHISPLPHFASTYSAVLGVGLLL
jgi:hypothetical protein